jgi:hypothetical protein
LGHEGHHVVSHHLLATLFTRASPDNAFQW